MLIYQQLIKQRQALQYIADISIARTTFAEAEDVSQMISDIKIDAGLPARAYLDEQLDKPGLLALAQQLSAVPYKKV